MTKLRTAILVVALGGGLAGLLAGDAATVGINAPRPAWSEVKWPFPLDQWGTGRAFRCAPADCGVEVNLYLRAKIGFCNCATGVSDDLELDRVGDVDLVGSEPTAIGPGRPVAVHWM